MKNKLLKTCTILGLCVLPASSFDREDRQYPKGTLFSVGASYSSYTTQWSAVENNQFNLTKNPEHLYTQTQIVLGFEKRSVLKMGDFRLDIHGDVQFGILGKIEQKYMDTFSSEISDGGKNINFLFQPRFVFPFSFTPRTKTSPYIGIGVGFNYLEGNGEGIDSSSLVRYESMGYTSGWSENLISFPLTLGINMDFKKITLNPEVRWAFYGIGASDWKPADPAPTISSFSTWSILFKLGFHIGE